MNREPENWTEQDVYDKSFLKCVECSPYNSIPQCYWWMPKVYDEQKNYNLRKAWIRGWQDARSGC